MVIALPLIEVDMVSVAYMAWLGMLWVWLVHVQCHGTGFQKIEPLHCNGIMPLPQKYYFIKTIV